MVHPKSLISIFAFILSLVLLLSFALKTRDNQIRALTDSLVKLRPKPVALTDKQKDRLYYETMPIVFDTTIYYSYDKKKAGDLFWEKNNDTFWAINIKMKSLQAKAIHGNYTSGDDNDYAYCYGIWAPGRVMEDTIAKYMISTIGGREVNWFKEDCINRMLRGIKAIDAFSNPTEIKQKQTK